MMSAGCSVFSGKQLTNPDPFTRIECERLAKKVGVPPARSGDDVRVVLARYAAALRLANQRLEDTSACLAQMAKGTE
jgi:hypothetical protein